MRGRWLAVAALLWLAVVVGLGVGPAEADTSLVGSEPVDGTTVSVRPEAVTLEFRSRILPSAEVAVVGPAGNPVHSGRAAVLDNRVQVPLSAAVNGDYTVVYRVVGDDGHVVQGQIAFAVDAPVDAPVDAARGGSWLSRNGGQMVGLAVVLILVGAVAALRLRRPRAAP